MQRLCAVVNRIDFHNLCLMSRFRYSGSTDWKRCGSNAVGDQTVANKRNLVTVGQLEMNEIRASI